MYIRDYRINSKIKSIRFTARFQFGQMWIFPPNRFHDDDLLMLCSSLVMKGLEGDFQL